MKLDITIARFPYMRIEDPDVGSWYAELCVKLRTTYADRFDKIHCPVEIDTPISMTRNKVVKDALANKSDLLLLVDADMRPDYPAENAKPFFDSSLEFMLAHDGPCIVAAPYCGPPPHENVYIFHWLNLRTRNPSVDLKLEQYSRKQAAERSGFEEVAALPTGLMLVDMRVFQTLKPTWFDYEFEDPPFNTVKATTEDVFFTRNATMAGVKVYCNWYSWAGHWKDLCVPPPSIVRPSDVRDTYRRAVAENNLASNESLLVFKSKVG